METYFIETWGCQMNVLDSQRLEGLLLARGMRRVERADDADVAVLNTCSVRDKAVQKVLSRLGELRVSRQACGRPRAIGLCGCVGEQEGERLFGRGAAPDFVLGPGRIVNLPAALDAAVDGRRVSFTGFSEDPLYDPGTIARGTSARQAITVVHGCNQKCTFCVVPYTRGRESSRPLDEIVAEATAVVAAGAKEITLLGQTVNAYRCPATGADFGDLIEAVAAVAGVWHVQFVTSHPKYFNQRMIGKIAATWSRGGYLHVPFQAGSDAVLRRMHRSYTRAAYLELVAALRVAMPNLTLSTDVIVGFPGEDNDDFAATLDLIRSVRFGQLFGFAFSPRPRTPAARYTRQVDRAVASERLEQVFELQAAVQLALNQSMVGRSVEILIDGPAHKGSGLWQGRGVDNRVVNVLGWSGIAAGQLATVVITGATAHSLLADRDLLPLA